MSRDILSSCKSRIPSQILDKFSNKCKCISIRTSSAKAEEGDHRGDIEII